MPMNITNKHIFNQLLVLVPSVQLVNCLLRTKMALHAIYMEQPILLFRTAIGTFQAADSPFAAECIKRVSRLESIERRVSCEEE